MSLQRSLVTELRLNNVERERTPRAQEIKSQLDSHSPEHLQKTDLSEVVQQICNINEEEHDTQAGKM
jgi:hypothetical protein